MRSVTRAATPAAPAAPIGVIPSGWPRTRRCCAPIWPAWTAGRRYSPFHTPGHKGSTALTGAVVVGDHPLAGGLDTIKMRHGWLEEAERRAAALYGADMCRFSAGGSTHCNQALALSIGVPGDVVVVSRTLHRSLLLGLVLAGLLPIWVEPEVSPTTGLPLAYAPERIAVALAEHPEARAVFLSDPSYVGTFSDLREHAHVAHRAGVPLLVDAAWAAHFGFHPALPPHALAAGADAMVTSAHKTLPAYSQAAWLFARTERLGASRLQRAFDALHTTSPAGTIMASMDAARALLERDGERLLGRAIAAVADARAELASVAGLTVLDGPMMDPAKLTVGLAGTGAHGVDVESDLRHAGVPVEMADRDTVVALVTLADDASTLQRLTATLVQSIERRRATPRAVTAAAGWIVSPQTRVAPREAFFGEVDTVPFASAAGRISAELIALYPPGVPILAPGELVTEQTLATLTEAMADGVRVAYAADPGLATLEVLAGTHSPRV